VGGGGRGEEAKKERKRKKKEKKRERTPDTRMHSETFRFTCVCSRASPTWPRKAISPKKNTRVARTYAYKRRLKNDEGKDIYIYIYIYIYT